MSSTAGEGILVVCTANVCRSPVVELLLTQRLRLGDAGHVTVSSAGVHGLSGHQIDAQMAELLEADGIDSVQFRARRLTISNIESAQLILTATAQHRSAVVQLVPQSLNRTFTIREFNHLVTEAGDLAQEGEPSRRLTLAQEAALRERPYHRLRPPELDVADPVGQHPSKYRATYAQLKELVDTLSGLIIAPVTQRRPN